MEKNLSDFKNLVVKEFLDGKDGNENPKLVSPIILAYVGDTVFDLVIRTYLLKCGNIQINKMNKKASKIVCATFQASIYDKIESILNEEETNIIRRGKNIKTNTKVRSATYEEYKKATGLETLIGYLYLNDDYKRIIELIKIGIEEVL